MIVSPTLRQTWPRELPEAAMCVQDVDVQCVLQFTLSNAASCALHRLASRVIHRSEVFQFAFYGALSESPQLKALRKKGGPKRFCTRPGGSHPRVSPNVHRAASAFQRVPRAGEQPERIARTCQRPAAAKKKGTLRPRPAAHPDRRLTPPGMGADLSVTGKAHSPPPAVPADRNLVADLSSQPTRLPCSPFR